MFENLKDAEVERGSVFTQRGRVDYAVFGSGSRPLVILPGMSLKPVTPLAGEIAKRYLIFVEKFRIYVLDRGENMPDGYTIHDMADDTAEALRELDVSSACIFGASQGGMIALSLALRYPELVDRMVLGSTWSRPNRVGMASFREWSRLGRSGKALELIRDSIRRIYSEADGSVIEAILNAAGSSATAEELRRFAVGAEAGLVFDVFERLKELKCPILVLCAEKDSVLGAAGAKEIAERLGCEFYSYSGADHAVYDEAADYPERILRFFEKNTDIDEKADRSAAEVQDVRKET